LLAISHANVLLTALKPGADGSTILRVYEAEGRAAEGVRIRFGADVHYAVEVNLMEDDGESLEVMDDEVVINLRPFEIRTLKLQLGRAEI
jgi:alpha-mannosidase